MRAAAQAHPSPVREHAARQLLIRTAAAILATVALLWVWRPTVVHAQAGLKDSASLAAASRAAKAAAKPKARPATRAPKDTSTTTHVVAAGETLWSIATRYYGDGHQWRALARRNGIATNGETAIEIGMKLQVPARGAVLAAAAVRPAVADTTVPKAAVAPAAVPAERPAPTPGLIPPARSGKLARQTAAKADAKSDAKSDAKAEAKPEPKVEKPAAAASVTTADAQAMAPRAALMPTVKSERILTRGPARIGLLDAGDLRASRGKGEGTTVFTHIVPDEAEAVAAVRAVTKRAEPAPRRGEFLAAPFPVSVSRWAQVARVVRRVDAASAGASDARLQFGDEVEVAAPTGKSLTVGEQLLAVRAGDMLPNGSQVAIPGGVLQITRAEGAKSFARVRSLSGAIDPSSALLPIEGAPAPSLQRTEPVSGQDVRSTITWLEEGTLLPTLQSYVLLSAVEGQGVRAGDQFAVVTKPLTGPEIQVAIVRIVRTSALGSTGIVVKQSGSEIAVGSVTRRVARVP